MDSLPATIPDLMLSYVNNINENVRRERQADTPDNRTVQKAAKLVAWACLKNDFRPGQPAAKAETEVDAQMLNYLESRLQLIRTVGVEEDRVQFLLDPLSEYLAALQAIDILRSDGDG
jgi:hypothetical protein